MLKENVLITVTCKGKKFAKIYTIESDGSFYMVQRTVFEIVKAEWLLPVQKISWNYL